MNVFLYLPIGSGTTRSPGLVGYNPAPPRTYNGYVSFPASQLHRTAFDSRPFVMGFTVYFKLDAGTRTRLAGGGHVENEGRGGKGGLTALEDTYKRHNIVLHMFFRSYVHMSVRFILPPLDSEIGTQKIYLLPGKIVGVGRIFIIPSTDELHKFAKNK